MVDTFIGKPIERVEDLRLLRGKGRYVDDIHLDGMLHAVVVRSQIPHGRILGIDVEQARELPGVRAAFTAREIAADYPGGIPKVPIRLYPISQMEPFMQHVIAVDKVRYVGEPIAIIVADTAALAEDAADLVQADIEPLPAVPDCSAATRNSVLLFESQGTNVLVTYTGQKGEGRTATGPYVRKERFSIQRHSASMMEPRGLVASWDDAAGKLTVLGAAKVPFSTAKLSPRNSLCLSRASISSKSMWAADSAYAGSSTPKIFWFPTSRDG